MFQCESPPEVKSQSALLYPIGIVYSLAGRYNQMDLRLNDTVHATSTLFVVILYQLAPKNIESKWTLNMIRLNTTSSHTNFFWEQVIYSVDEHCLENENTY